MYLRRCEYMCELCSDSQDWASNILLTKSSLQSLFLIFFLSIKRFLTLVVLVTNSVAQFGICSLYSMQQYVSSVCNDMYLTWVGRSLLLASNI